VTGIWMLSTKSQLDDNCLADGACPPDEQDRLDRYQTLGTISAVAFGVGVVGVGTGVALLLTAKDEPAADRAKARITPYVGLGSVGAVGRF
jgi:hypothetical protein